MDIANLIDADYVVPLVSALAGAILAYVVQSLRSKRGVFTYQVNHSTVGISGDDPIYGSVRLTWNDDPVPNLFLSTIEVTNHSVKDYESVTIRFHTNNTVLLSGTAYIVGSTETIGFTERYRSRIFVPFGGEPNQQQSELYLKTREYLIPAINRGQVLRFDVLNAAESTQVPSMSVDIQHVGVVCKFQKATSHAFGVRWSLAVTVGTVAGIVAVLFVASLLNNAFAIGVLSFLIGGMTSLIGIGIVRVFRRLRSLLAG